MNQESLKGKNIAFITHNCNFANNFLLPQIQLYENFGARVILVSSLDLDEPDELIEHFINIDIKQSPFKILSNYRAFKKLKYIIEERKIDLIYCHTPMGGVLGRLIKIPYPNLEVIYTAHGFHFFRGGSVIGWLLYYPIERILSRLTDKLVLINEEDFHVAQKFHAKKTYLIPGVGLSKEEENSEYLRHKKFDTNNITFINIGQLNKNKNHITLLKFLKDFKNVNKNFNLNILGRGLYQNVLENYIVTNDLKNNVKLIGYVDNVIDYLDVADIIVSTSMREGLPKSILEGLNRGLPAIVSNTRGNRDLIKSGYNGYVMNSLTYKEFFFGVNLILNNYHEMSGNAILSSKEYLFANLKDKYIAMISENIE